MGFFTFGDFGDEQFHGKIEENIVELRKRKSFFWRNDFAPHLFAELKSSTNGTRIEGYFGFASKVRWFTIIWISVVLSIAALFLIQLVNSDSNDRSWTNMLAPLGMAAWGFLMPRISYFFSHFHEGELLEFMRDILMAK